MIKPQWCILAVFVLACGGASAPPTVAPTMTAQGAVESFMQGVADSNLTQMGNFWGGAGGPAARTGSPADWQRRVAIMHAYLRNESHRIVSDTPAGDARHSIQVEIRRQLCSWVIPFTAIRLGDGSWIVSQVDVTQAGNPARPCEPGAPADSAKPQQ